MLLHGPFRVNALQLLSPSSPRVALVLALTLAACQEGRSTAPVPAPALSTPPPAPLDSARPAAPLASSDRAPLDAAPVAIPDDAGPLGASAAATRDVDAGVDAGTASDPGCPEGMARVGRFCIDRWEARLVRRGDAGEVVSLSPTERPPEDGDYEAWSEPGVFPQAYISRVESARACKSAGKRLCSMAEWHRACEGKKGQRYPYGGQWQAKKCNSEKPHLLTLRFGADARHWRYEDFNDPSLDKEPGFLEKTGVFDQCGGDFGVYDLVGNLHEWVSDTVDDALLGQMDSEDITRNRQPSHTGNGVFLGGFFSTHTELGPGCTFTTVAHEPTYHDYSTGFRCCAPALPAPLPDHLP
jgi:formylglycine-generating enzyme